MVKLWKLQEKGCKSLTVGDMSSLDAVTRSLPGGYYTTFRTFDTRRRVLGLRSHLDRLYRPALGQGLTPSIPRDDLRRVLASLLADFPSEEARLRLVLTVDADTGAIYAAIEPFTPPAQEIYRKGVRVLTTRAHRATPVLKTTDFIGQSQSERKKVAGSAAYEGLLITNGRILEGLTSNFFYVRDGALGTARSGVLNGVTRRGVLKLAKGQGMSLIFRALRLSEIGNIDEAFLTSSSRGIVPIITIDNLRVGTGRVGEWTRRLRDAWQIDVLKRAEPILPASSARHLRRSG